MIRTEPSMIRRVVRTAYGLSLALGLFGMMAGSLRAAGEGQVYVLPADGVVDNVLAGYITESIAKAEREGVAAVVIRLNTPGGALDATQKIVSGLLEANVPTIVWVAPAGGRAASAGTFITLAAHVALMAPATNIGAASPVLADGTDLPETLKDKAFNDLKANIRAIAEERGRNVDWAVSAVERAVSAPASEAVELDVVDGIARTLDEVIAFADGREVVLGGTPATIELSGAATQELAMNPFQAFLHLLSDPNIAALLFSIGSLGLIYELMSPNFVTGIMGALAIILAFIGFGSLPLNVGGLLLIGLAMLLFVLEVTVVSHGLLTVGGIVCFALGASALYTTPGTPTAPDVSVATPLIVAMTLTVAGFMGIALLTVIRSRRRIPALAIAGYGAGGSTSLSPGTPGEVRMALSPIGSVYAAGEEWTARSAGGTLERGTPVRVIAQEGLTLIVEPVEPAGAGA
jgi:membrane-bound serine protease (ClpP class)